MPEIPHVTSPPRRQPLARLPRPRWLDLVAALAAVAGVVWAGAFALPPTVPAITFENPTTYDLSVAAAPEDGDGWVAVSVVANSSSKLVLDVIDQGDAWRFRFRSQGRAGGEVTMTRAELEAADWHVAVPDVVGERLADLDAPPSP
jgi:hypothetical protein